MATEAQAIERLKALLDKVSYLPRMYLDQHNQVVLWLPERKVRGAFQERLYIYNYDGEALLEVRSLKSPDSEDFEEEVVTVECEPYLLRLMIVTLVVATLRAMTFPVKLIDLAEWDGTLREFVEAIPVEVDDEGKKKESVLSEVFWHAFYTNEPIQGEQLAKVQRAGAGDGLMSLSQYWS